jgi:hypothetical protein
MPSTSTSGGEDERPLYRDGRNNVCVCVCLCDVVHVWMYDLYRDVKLFDSRR